MAKVSYRNQNGISAFYQSFSGTDTIVFLLFPGSKPIMLGALTTISYSIYRNKRPVINIGRTNINGMTRGSRIFAGTMIFTLINQHWVREAQRELKWLKGFEHMKADELPLFDAMIISANEYGSYASMYIFGIDFTDEAQTISVEDLFTENVFQFVARDIETFKAGEQFIKDKGGKYNSSTVTGISDRFYVMDSSAVTKDQIDRLVKDEAFAKSSQIDKDKLYESLGRELYYSPSNLMMGRDVLDVQQKLNTLKIRTEENAIFDQNTRDKVMEFQSANGLDVDGVIKDKDYALLKDLAYLSSSYEPGQEKIKKITGLIVNKDGAYVFKDANTNETIVENLPFKTFVEIYDMVPGVGNESYSKFYRTLNGYVSSEDIYSVYEKNSFTDFPTIKINDDSIYVSMVQMLLSSIYSAFNDIDGYYGTNTQNYVKKFQSDNDLDPSGIVDRQTWTAMNSVGGSIAKKLDLDAMTVTNEWAQGKYTMPYYTEDESLSSRLRRINSTIKSLYPMNIKISVICKYENGETEEYSKNFSNQGTNNYSITDFIDRLNYSPKMGSRPVSMEYILYPYNKTPYKWTIDFV